MIKTIPRRGFRFEADVRSERTPLAEAAAPSLPDKPSIAVLPFENMSGDPEQEYFADGISEETLNLLARLKELKVIARVV